MDVREADRAQSVQVGVIFLFGFLIVGLSLYQVTVVPEQNQQVEFNAYQQAAEDLTDVRNDVLTAAGRDTTIGTTVKTGVEYPSRAIFVNPGPPPNRLATTGERNVTLENVEAVDSEAENTRTFLESNVSGRSYATRDVVFTPNYDRFTGQPMVVTGHQSYRVAGDRPIPMTGQTVLQEDRIRLIRIDGDLEAGGSSVGVTTEPVSPATRTVVVQGKNDEDITLRFEPPSGISASGWNETTGQELRTANPQRVERVVEAPDGSHVEVILNGSMTYRLQLATVEVRDRETQRASEDPVARYLITIQPSTQTVRTGETTEIVVEVRDRFNNPVSGETVTVDGSPRGALDSTSERTDGDGTVRFEYTAPENTGADSVDLSINDGSESYERVAIGFDVVSQAAGAPGSEPPIVDITSPSEGESIEDDFDLNATITSIDQSGTPILAANWSRQSPVNTDPEPFDSISADGPDGCSYCVIDGTQPIDISGWTSGEHTLRVTGRDASGQVGNDTVTIDVAEPDLTFTDLRDSGDRLVFGIANEAGQEVTIEEVGVDATAIDTEIYVDHDNNDREVQITGTSVQDGHIDTRGEKTFSADGTLYDLENGGNNGQYATLGPDDSDVEIDIRYFSQDLGSLEYTTDEANADVSVILRLSDGSEYTFHFRQSN
ncbi:Ig-like domain-containing protein [Halopenitus sp. H-Gu1]|uniref:Ig-like domain-containing protein n=1 Tax=Halopenitus sp. H-Gu1 TaxID=3242697 RepID=UPI00359EDDEE